MWVRRAGGSGEQVGQVGQARMWVRLAGGSGEQVGQASNTMANEGQLRSYLLKYIKRYRHLLPYKLGELSFAI
jgi:hypothetical protein